MTPAISPVGFGAFKIGRNVAAKYAAAYDLPDLPAVEKLLHGILDLGVTYIDTAPAYGLSEERIGQTLAHRRREFVLSTKVGEFFENGISRYDFSPTSVRQSVEQSLRRLRTDAVDLLFVHSSRDDVRVLQQTDLVDTMISLRAAGLTRGIGFSGYTLEAFRAALPWTDSIMVEYHSDDLTLAPVIAEAAARNVAVIVKKGLATGRIPATQSIPFVLRNPAVTTVVVGSLSLDHMRENLRVARTVRSERVFSPSLPCGEGGPNPSPSAGERAG